MECCGGKKIKARFIDEDVDLSLLDNILSEYKNVKGSLITILQQAQEIYGYLPLSVLDYVANETKVKSSKVYGVATFYAQFRLIPSGQNVIKVCTGTACHVRGGQKILDRVCSELNIKPGETSADGKFSLEPVACLGACGLAPVMMINDSTFGRLTPAKVSEILAKY